MKVASVSQGQLDECYLKASYHDFSGATSYVSVNRTNDGIKKIQEIKRGRAMEAEEKNQEQTVKELQTLFSPFRQSSLASDTSRHSWGQ
jgi:hypothetical protein